jgi:hypothetical protein
MAGVEVVASAKEKFSKLMGQSWGYKVCRREKIGGDREAC